MLTNLWRHSAKTSTYKHAYRHTYARTHAGCRPVLLGVSCPALYGRSVLLLLAVGGSDWLFLAFHCLSLARTFIWLSVNHCQGGMTDSRGKLEHDTFKAAVPSPHCPVFPLSLRYWLQSCLALPDRMLLEASPQLNRLPQLWLNCLLAHMQRGGQCRDDIVRRSAGLPAAFVAVFTAEPTGHPKTLLHQGTPHWPLEICLSHPSSGIAPPPPFHPLHPFAINLLTRLCATPRTPYTPLLHVCSPILSPPCCTPQSPYGSPPPPPPYVSLASSSCHGSPITHPSKHR